MPLATYSVSRLRHNAAMLCFLVIILASYALMPYINPMSAAKLKTEVVQLRLDEEEKAKLQALADKEKMSVSAYLRYLIHREPLK